MSYLFARRAAGLVALIATTACGPAPNTPTAPSLPTLSQFLLPKVGGLWDGTLTFNSITGGTGIVRSAGLMECVGSTFASALGQSNDSSLQITQDRLNVTARLTSAETGLACSYSGSIGAYGGMVLDASSCTELPLIIQCLPDDQGNAPVRQMVLVGSTLTANLNAPVNVTEVSGGAAHTYNVLDAGGQPLGGLVANHSFNLTRR